MQKFITLITFVIIVISANAQFQKGNKVLGAGLNFQTVNSDYPSYTSSNTGGSVALDLGFAQKENSLLGFYLNAGYGRSKFVYVTPGITEHTNNYNGGAGLFFKSYKSLGKGFYVFGEGRAGVSFQQQETSGNQNGWDMLNAGIGLYPGITYKWNNRFMLDLRFADFVSINYSSTKYENSSSGTSSTRNFSINSSLGLGYLSNFGIGARWIIK